MCNYPNLLCRKLQLHTSLHLRFTLTRGTEEFFTPAHKHLWQQTLSKQSPFLLLLQYHKKEWNQIVGDKSKEFFTVTHTLCASLTLSFGMWEDLLSEIQVIIIFLHHHSHWGILCLLAARSWYLPWNLHLQHCMKMGDLFLLTLRVIVYALNSHVGGKAMQGNRERKRVKEEKLEGGSVVKLPPQ